MMVPDYFNSPPSPFPSDDREHQFFFPAYDHQASSSSYSMFFPDQAEPCSFQMHQDHQPQQVEDANYQVQYTGSQGLADHEIKPSKGLKITLWKNNEKSGDRQNPVKWMSSKMRMMQKMKNKSAEHDDQDNYRHQNSPRESTTDDHFSSSNSSSNNSTAPFRVCSDCNTTKTPLWRSGPKGPKSLCNACGIRQRKARRAMAAAGAASAAADPQTDQAKSKTAAVLKIKVQSKEKVKNNGVQIINTTPFKKRSTRMICGGAASPEEPPPAHAEQKSSVFEDFLINLSNNLAVHRVFPQDEKEAAILLMAISSGLVHG